MLRSGFRVRVAAIAAAVVGVALVAGALVLVGVLRTKLDDAATTTAALRARDVATLAEADALPFPLALPGEESAFVQIVDAAGSVVASTENIEGEGPVSSIRPGPSGQVVLTVDAHPLDGRMRVAAVNATIGRGAGREIVTVYAGESLDEVASTTTVLIVLLAIGMPVLLLIVGAITWWAVGRTLRPVRQITDTMSEITTSDLHRRVPVPDGSDEISSLATTVNETLARLDSSVDTQRRFVADASHELRGPLAALRADLEISVTHPEQTSWTSVVHDALGDVDRLEHLTDDLLLLARLDAQAQSPRADDVDIVDAVTDALHLMRRTDLDVTVGGLEANAVVHGDRDQLHRLVRNLVRNASQHAIERIAVEVVLASDSVALVVSDDGPGIPPEQREAVFERFTRLDTARSRDTGGSGLGLAIVAEVVVAHGGAVTVTNGALGGATFAVTLPRSVTT